MAQEVRTEAEFLKDALSYAVTSRGLDGATINYHKIVGDPPDDLVLILHVSCTEGVAVFHFDYNSSWDDLGPPEFVKWEVEVDKCAGV